MGPTSNRIRIVDEHPLGCKFSGTHEGRPYILKVQIHLHALGHSVIGIAKTLRFGLCYSVYWSLIRETFQNRIFPTNSMARPPTVTPVTFAVWPVPISASG